jgi:hypothetical protein
MHAPSRTALTDDHAGSPHAGASPSIVMMMPDSEQDLFIKLADHPDFRRQRFAPAFRSSRR